MSKRKPNWANRERVLLLEEYVKRKVILKGKFSSSITSRDKNRARQEIANREKEKRNLEIEKLKLEKQKLNMEKNKLALEIWKLKYEMSLQGIDVQIPVFTLCKRCTRWTDMGPSKEVCFR